MKKLSEIYVFKYNDMFRVIDFNTIRLCYLRESKVDYYTVCKNYVEIEDNLSKIFYIWFKDEESATAFMNAFEEFTRYKYDMRDDSFQKI
jgi:hypothetical protein